MNKRTSLAAAFLLMLASAAAGQTFLQGPFAQALDQAKNQGKPVLIDFFSDG